MPFSVSIREEVLVKSHRRCCVCHEFSGRAVNVHHIVQEADGGSNAPENAIVLCLRCHEEAGHFNPRHPLGTKYSPDELRRHRDQWREQCSQPPDPIPVDGCDVNISFKNGPANTGDLHTYRLLASFTNNSSKKQEGYTLELWFPFDVPVECLAWERVTPEEVIDDCSYFCCRLRSDETTYRGQTVQVVDERRHPVTYQMNHKLYYSLRTLKELRFRWRLFVGDLPKMEGATPWGEMHDF